MSKISNVILFLEYLNSGKKYSVQELSEKVFEWERELIQEAGKYL